MLLFAACRKSYVLLLWIIGILILHPLTFYSQVDQVENITIRGTVISADESEPLIGVNILEKGTTHGTITDFDGNYEISVRADAILVFKYISYEDQEIPVEGRTQIDVRMEPEVEILEDVVVVGYRKEIKSHVASAISSVKSESIEKIPVLGFDQA